MKANHVDVFPEEILTRDGHAERVATMNGEGDDSEMMDQLRRALISDRPPEELLTAAKASFTWRSVDAELAELLSDSSTEALTGVRSGDGPRTLEFASAASSVALEIVESGPAIGLRGQISPSGPTEVVVESTTASLTLAIDGDGWFNGTVNLTGNIRLRADGIVTDWFSL